MSTLEEIVDRFQLKSGTKRTARAQLIKLLKSTHPDGTGGAFRNEEQQTLHKEISDAIERLDKVGSKQLATVGARTVLTLLEQQNKILVEQQERAERQVTLDRSAERLRVLEAGATASLRREVARHYLPQKVSAAAMGALGVFLTASGSSFSVLLSSEITAPMLSAMFLISGAVLGLSAFLYEERAKNRRQDILSEHQFEKFIYSPEFNGNLSYDGSGEYYYLNTISYIGITAAIHDFAMLDMTSSEEVARVMAERLLSRGLAVKSQSPSLSPVLRLEDKLAENISLKEYERKNKK